MLVFIMEDHKDANVQVQMDIGKEFLLVILDFSNKI